MARVDEYFLPDIPRVFIVSEKGNGMLFEVLYRFAKIGNLKGEMMDSGGLSVQKSIQKAAFVRRRDYFQARQISQ